jgi:chaperonin GroES|tara:strand:+ start:1291 stop:1551 length:261 start_codon:yes stop_codon:yes gene_type:complete
MKAVGKYIVIDPVKEENVKTKGGLILTDKQREDIRYRIAKVKSVGTDVNGVKAGNEIYYDKVAGTKIEIDKQEYQVIKEQDVVIIL